MATLNYTTKIPVSRTVGEVQNMLAQHGADAVATRYVDRRPCGVSFVLDTPHGKRTFTLPVDVDAVQNLLLQQERAGEFRSSRKAAGTFSSSDHAARVAWRVLKDWLEAQLAIIEAQMATLAQVMLPYMHVDGEVTLYEAYQARELKALPRTVTG